jgi:peptidoglycan/xylan/chitin deacetylase (PgdA/CDA1 family)
MKQFFKKIILALSYYSGFFELIRWISVRKGYVPILLYHRISDDTKPDGAESCFSLLGIGISKGLFEKQLAYLKKRYRLISLKEYVQKKKEGADIRGCAVVTFDDGFCDIGLSILRRYNIPATIFLIGESFEKIFWRHQLFFMLDEARVLKTSFKTPSGKILEVDLSESFSKREALSAVSRIVQPLSETQRDQFFEELKQSLGLTKKYAARDVYFTQEDAEKLAQYGISLGAHSQTHRDLTLLSDEELSREIEVSKVMIERLTQDKDVPFAIPFGRYDDRVLRAIKKIGVYCNLTSDNGLDSKEGDIFRMKRIFVNTRTIEEFIYKISGVESWWSP